VKLELVKAAEQRSALETELALVTQQLENETIELDRVEQKNPDTAASSTAAPR
jgi:hypothetical protein